MQILLFGPPGAGKGTQAELLVRHYGLAHISTGIIIREAISTGSFFGNEAKKYVNEGRLLPFHLIREVAAKAISEKGFKNFILDGFPRTVEQAKWLSAYVKRHNTTIDAVISIQVSDDVIVERLSKRRVHRITGETYHVDFKPPPEDVDPDLIVQRPDDQPDAIRRRLKIYYAETEPVEEYYMKCGILHVIDGEQPVDEVFDRIKTILNETVNAEDSV